ncbi:MAG: hypothetical protein H7Y59_14310 [Anaerolineales bacterium]|nr:hypothetical protein [Anaerolineales bacterium]
MNIKLALQRFLYVYLAISLVSCRTIPQEQPSTITVSTTTLPTSTSIPETSTVVPTETLLVSSPTPMLLGLQPSILVSGLIDHVQGTGNLDPIYTLESIPDVPTPGIYGIRLEDDAGQEIAFYSFDVGFSYDPSGFGGFVLVLPSNSNTTRIVLLKDGVEMDSRSASKNVPVVKVISPDGGENLSDSPVTISWSAVDADNDSLEYVVQYSVDGGKQWQTLTVGYPGTTLDLDLSFVSNTDIGLIRVFASDGFHTSQDQSDAVFSVTTEKEIYVDIFDDDGVYSGDQTIVLEGEAYTDMGNMTEFSLAWSSDIDGFLGEGEDLAINASELSEGTHVITLTAQNENDQTGTASITIQIYREFSSLSIDEEPLSFVAQQGDIKTLYQILSIWHLGGHSLTWSATADQSWIMLGSTNGSTPTEIAVSANPTGLSAGTYTGTITVTSNAEGVNTQTLSVTLQIKK